MSGTSSHPTAAVVLAGGASSRFGSDKLAADLDGRPVLAHVVAAAAAVAGTVIVVVGPDDPDPGIARARLARDPVAHAGPLAGLVAGLEALAPFEADAVAIVLAGDMPHVPPAVLALLADTLAADSGLALAHLEAEPLHPMPMAVRPSVALPAARAVLDAGRRSLRALVAAVPSTAVPAARWRALDPTGRTLRDIDTPGDLAGR